ncbi:MAG: hypothetical protein A3F47_02445 [Candidatus Staskawiczbacteria bacterium RIFCSPHIGHO2_12_FULL_38_11]|uniref:Uncharacterized protein n=1 Tax=Candidatus Staskawiczbacteria bacterium RIFCSPHIGHO2_12_FULL_38_11 TaxID=1802209 RepID=A0A1G2I548_9BACT|nr:MAG: hypothetical protein A3F47_02445 [Candidatus Staskawiczbacteria bacterium RIFCSPHIGHO2_12_FULL_38_11]
MRTKKRTKINFKNLNFQKINPKKISLRDFNAIMDEKIRTDMCRNICCPEKLLRKNMKFCPKCDAELKNTNSSDIVPKRTIVYKTSI